jgi:diphosphomevalonate decarboxylase
MPSPATATAIAHPNIALIKYWGNRDEHLRLPSNGSMSMTLGGLQTEVTVAFDDDLTADQFSINDSPAPPASLDRVAVHIDFVRSLAEVTTRARIVSRSNFPSGVGIASSAAAFAALTVASCSALGMDLAAKDLSRIARRGSGSASRSIFGGFVEWYAADEDSGSYSEPIADKDHWDLVDLIALVSRSPKAVGSTEGHARAASSPLQAGRVADTPRRLTSCRHAILAKDFPALAEVAELDSNMMHSVMMTSDPPVYYWTAETIRVMRAVRGWRSSGASVFFTIDAGPNVHCICPASEAAETSSRLLDIPGVDQVLSATVGGPARQVEPRKA